MENGGRVLSEGEYEGEYEGGGEDPATRLVRFALSRHLLVDVDAAEGWSEVRMPGLPCARRAPATDTVCNGNAAATFCAFLRFSNLGEISTTAVVGLFC